MYKNLFTSIFVIFLLVLTGCTHQPELKETPTHNAMNEKMKKLPQMFQSVKASEATLVQNGADKHSCVKCGMNLVKFYKTSHTASEEKSTFQYCSIHCLAEHLDEGNELKNPQVVDVTTLELIPVLEAYYVVGSKIRGTMSRVSKYAFKNLDDAKAFQEENGGKILDFYGALNVAREDFN